MSIWARNVKGEPDPSRRICLTLSNTGSLELTISPAENEIRLYLAAWEADQAIKALRDVLDQQDKLHSQHG